MKQPSATTRPKRNTARQAAKVSLRVTSQVPKTEREDFMALLGLEAKNSLEVVQHVERGLRFSVVERLRQEMDLPTKKMADLLQV
jgi:hypothetical protein